jgi:hypothetical protein
MVGAVRRNGFRPVHAGSVVVDLQETPATPPEDFGSDERLGWAIASGLLIFFGWGIAIVVNLLVHAMAPAGGVRLAWGVWIGPHMGGFAWITFGIGLFAGTLGAVFLYLARSEPRGPFVLPGYDYGPGKTP